MKTKRILAAFLAAILLALAGCGGSQQQAAQTDPVVESYRNAAQQFIDAGDYASAQSVLEEAVQASSDAGLAALLEEVKAKAAEAGAPGDENADPAAEGGEAADVGANPYSDYAGLWADTGLVLSEGGVVLEVSTTADTVTLQFSLIGYDSRHFTVPVEKTVKVDEITDSSVTIDFSDDFLLYAGSITTTFMSSSKIFCEIVIDDILDRYYVPGGDIALVRNPNAKKIMEGFYGPQDDAASTPAPTVSSSSNWEENIIQVDEIGWISTDDGTGLNVRSLPSPIPDSQVIDQQVPDGTFLQVQALVTLDNGSVWGFVSYDGNKSGWVLMKYVTDDPSDFLEAQM